MPKKTLSSCQKKNNDDLDTLLQAANNAAKRFRTYSQQQVDAIVEATALALKQKTLEIAEMLQNEFNIGNLEDKYLKLESVIETLNNYLRDKKTVGIIHQDLDTGITEIAEPVGVVAAITNCTGAGAIEILKSLNALKTRNAIVFAPHPNTAKSAKFVCDYMHRAAVAAGAPQGCIQCIEQPSVNLTQSLMSHQLVSIVWATGGKAMVSAAHRSGKPAIGVGPGNTPVLVSGSVDTDRVIEDILKSKLFENGTSCTAESNLIIHHHIKNKFLTSLKKYGCHILNAHEKLQLLDYMFPLESDKRKFNTAIVGKATAEIIKAANLNLPLTTKILIYEMANHEIGEKFPVSGEKLSNVLGMYTVATDTEGLKIALATLEYVGKGHTAAIHSDNYQLIDAFSEQTPVSRIVINAPATFGGAFDTYNKRVPSYSVGCGAMGGSSSTQNIGYRELLDIKRASLRKERNRWYIIPKTILKDQKAKKYLKTLQNDKIFLVVDPALKAIVVKKLTNWLPKGNRASKVFVCSNVEPDPRFETIESLAKSAQKFKPNLILAVGGGSAIDTAKGIWLKYEHPNLDLQNFGLPFNDIFEQVTRTPKMGVLAKLIAIPTTCGTGSEVTPFAVFTESKSKKKCVIGSYELTPNVTLLIPDFINTLPTSILVDTAFDALTHAIEAYVSIKDCKNADKNAIVAVKSIFANLEKAYLHNDQKAKANLLYASCEAGKAIANSFVGINHSLAHQLGANFHIPHGRANAMFLIPIIKYNSTSIDKHARPTPAYPNQLVFNAEARYADLARIALGITGADKKIVNEFCNQINKLMDSVGMSEIIAKTKLPKINDQLISQMAKNAFTDVCTRVNPRSPNLKELEELFRATLR